MGAEKNDIVTLERADTRDEGILKSTPIVGKTDYSGAYEKTDPREMCVPCYSRFKDALLTKFAARLSRSSIDGLCPCSGPCTGSTIWTAMP